MKKLPILLLLVLLVSCGPYDPYSYKPQDFSVRYNRPYHGRGTTTQDLVLLYEAAGSGKKAFENALKQAEDTDLALGDKSRDTFLTLCNTFMECPVVVPKVEFSNLVTEKKISFISDSGTNENGLQVNTTYIIEDREWSFCPIDMNAEHITFESVELFYRENDEYFCTFYGSERGLEAGLIGIIKDRQGNTLCAVWLSRLNSEGTYGQAPYLEERHLSDWDSFEWTTFGELLQIEK